MYIYIYIYMSFVSHFIDKFILPMMSCMNLRVSPFQMAQL